MAEEPEQVLPEKRRPARMRLQAITYHQAGRNEEAGPCRSIQNQEYASRKEHSEGQQSDARSDEPRPSANRHAHQGHALGAQVQGRGDKVERSKQGANAENGDRNCPEVHAPFHARPSILADRAQRCIGGPAGDRRSDRKSTRLNSSHDQISYAVFCFKKKKTKATQATHTLKQSNEPTV